MIRLAMEVLTFLLPARYFPIVVRIAVGPAHSRLPPNPILRRNCDIVPLQVSIYMNATSRGVKCITAPATLRSVSLQIPEAVFCHAGHSVAKSYETMCLVSIISVARHHGATCKFLQSAAPMLLHALLISHYIIRPCSQWGSVLSTHMCRNMIGRLGYSS